MNLHFDDEQALFRQLDNDLKPYARLLAEASETIVDEGVSHYPVMLVSQDELELGIEVFNTSSSASRWNVNAATLEMLLGHRVIEGIKLDEFRQLYKKKQPAVCLLVWSDRKAHFVFWKHDYA